MQVRGVWARPTGTYIPKGRLLLHDLGHLVWGHLLGYEWVIPGTAGRGTNWGCGGVVLPWHEQSSWWGGDRGQCVARCLKTGQSCLGFLGDGVNDKSLEHWGAGPL